MILKKWMNVGLGLLLSGAIFLQSCSTGAGSDSQDVPEGESVNAPEEKNGRIEPKVSATDAGELGGLVKNALTDLIQYCQDGKYGEAASLMIYKASNPDQVWKEPYNYAIEEDAEYVEKGCAKLQSLLHNSSEMVFKEFITEEEDEGLWHIWLVDVKYEDGNVEEHGFAFLRYGEKAFGLGDID